MAAQLVRQLAARVAAGRPVSRSWSSVTAAASACSPSRISTLVSRSRWDRNALPMKASLRAESPGFLLGRDGLTQQLARRGEVALRGQERTQVGPGLRHGGEQVDAIGLIGGYGLVDRQGAAMVSLRLGRIVEQSQADLVPGEFQAHLGILVRAGFEQFLGAAGVGQRRGGSIGRSQEIGQLLQCHDQRLRDRWIDRRLSRERLEQLDGSLVEGLGLLPIARRPAVHWRG